MSWSSLQTRILLAFPIGAVLAFLLLSCAELPDRYLTKNVGLATQEEIAVRLGPPDHKRVGEQGEAIWTYIIHVSYQTYLTYANPDSEVCYTYVLTFDPQKVLKKVVSNSADCGAVNAERVGS